MSEPKARIEDLSARNRAIFRQLVETYLDTGEPVGSRTLSRKIEDGLSPATIRNVMQDLSLMGLLDAPHSSAGRVPTQQGLRLFIDGLLQIGELDERERDAIRQALTPSNSAAPDQRPLEEMLDEAGAMLSGLSHCASLIMAPTRDAPIRHVEILPLAADPRGGRALLVLVGEDETVENRVLSIPPGLTPSAIAEATNFLNAHLRGLTLNDAREQILRRLRAARRELDALAAKLVEIGAATWTEDQERSGRDVLIVRGRSNLLNENLQEAQDLERVRMLFDDLERHRNLSELLDLAQSAEGVRVFIGSENKLYSLSGSSLVIAPYMNAQSQIIGAIGVIGPTRLNYGRIVPIVDYTARMVGRLIGEQRPTSP